HVVDTRFLCSFFFSILSATEEKLTHQFNSPEEKNRTMSSRLEPPRLFGDRDGDEYRNQCHHTQGVHHTAVPE
ncbi:hypothetical protein LINPERPRIM_LOCUS12097, partial [Linum perenne]